jgi:hypothetical protein
MTISFARRPETDGRSPQAVPADPATAGYLLPATGRGTAARAAAASGMRTGPWVTPSPVLILRPSRYPTPAANRPPRADGGRDATRPPGCGA